MNMNKKNGNRRDLSAAASGTVSLGGELTVNRLGFGAIRITGDGIWGPPKDRGAAIAVLRLAIELGVNFIDTADSYGPFVSEELIAEALTPYPKDLVIATKGGWNRPGPNQWTHDASPAHLRKAVEGSLKRLRLERIDVYQLHAPDPAVPLDASLETLANMQSEGKIRLVALSNVTVEHIGIAFIPWFPLGAGTVAGRLLEKIAKTRKAKSIQIALAWLLKRSPIMLPIPGTSSIVHLQENVRAASLLLSDEDYLELTGIAQLAS